MGWNGADLVTEFSAELGDSTASFKTKVLGWINDGLRDISSSYDWGILRRAWLVSLATGTDEHEIGLGQPAAPAAAIADNTGIGDLEIGATYSVLVTFLTTGGIESVAGLESQTVTAAIGERSIAVANIPLGTSGIVTQRKLYLKKNNGEYYYSDTIENNTFDTWTITEDTTSTLRPPREEQVRKVDGDLYIAGSSIIENTSIQDLLYKTSARVTTGRPQIFAQVTDNVIRVYPRPATTTLATLYIFYAPPDIENLSTSVPVMPAWIKDDLRNYVIWRGYSYRDRDGQESKKINYDEGLKITYSRKGKIRKGAGRVRCTTPDSDGYVN